MYFLFPPVARWKTNRLVQTGHLARLLLTWGISPSKPNNQQKLPAGQKGVTVVILVRLHEESSQLVDRNEFKSTSLFPSCQPRFLLPIKPREIKNGGVNHALMLIQYKQAYGNLSLSIKKKKSYNQNRKQLF